MQYFRTTLATDWAKDRGPSSVLGKLGLRVLTTVLPRGNPEYDDKMHLIRAWLVEVDEDGDVLREIALDAEGEPLLIGPDDRNCGFWADIDGAGDHIAVNGGEPVGQSAFEELWSRAHRV